MAMVVGVDGGNTKTVALVCGLDGNALGIGRGGSSNWEFQGEKKAAAVITDVVGQALSMAGKRLNDVVWAHMGLAGLDWPDDEPRMRGALTEAGWECEIGLENDAFLAMRACAPDGYGIGVTAGTGVASGIIRPNGDKFFYGAFTDLGTGHGINSQTLQAVIRAEDGRGQPTAMTRSLLEATGDRNTTEMVYGIHRRDTSPSSGILRRVLFAAAAKGDPVAIEIVTDFASELALCATNLVRRYKLENEEVAVVAAGSLFMKTGPLLFDTFKRIVLAGAAKAKPILANHPPLMGAVRGALSGCGRYEPELWARVSASVEKTGWLREDLGLSAQGDDNGD